jgi:hypothetical protein
VRVFHCPRCGQIVFFEDFACGRCGLGLGFSVGRRSMVALDQTVARCGNQDTAGCNWLVPYASAGALCLSCQLTRTRPNDADLMGDAGVAAAFSAAEGAKRRVVFQLLELDLPFETLSFDLLLSTLQPVTTGHVDGVVTMDLAEFDDAHRERVRQELAEPYRTLLGHLRHEVGHYYWQVFVGFSSSSLPAYRALFGDERADYSLARERHYASGPPAGWENEYVSAYATMHPWEDWAETFAHYLHIRDSLQTAASFGVIVVGPDAGPSRTRLHPAHISAPLAYPEQNFDDILANWIPLTSALNAINRSMGHADLYPFVLSLPVMEKLAFVHRLVVQRSQRHHQ